MNSWHFILGLVIGCFLMPFLVTIFLLIRCWFEDRDEKREEER